MTQWRTFARAALSAASVVLVLPAVEAQMTATETVEASVSVPMLLPDAPEASSSLQQSSAVVAPTTQQGLAQERTPARRLALTIRPNETAQPWTAKEKLEAGIVKEASLGGVSSMVFSAAWGTWRDLRPHYGTDAGAFGQRVGAAAVRQTSQSFFNVGLYSTLLHDDPRYYVKGPAYPIKQRFFYAASRVLVTRKDSGGNTFNLPLIAGVMSSSALTNAYYPDEDDHSVSRTLLSGLFSLTYRVGTQELKEFSSDIRERLHLKH